MKRAEIGKRIERLRIQRGLSALGLADQIEKSQATISRIENGKQGISLELLSNIARVLRVHPFALLSETPLRHSVLLPPAGTIRSDEPMRILARTIKCARLRANMELPLVAEHLGMEVDELEAVELGYAVPDREMLETIAGLYGIDEKALAELAKVEHAYPGVSERLAATENLLGVILNELRIASRDEQSRCDALAHIEQAIEQHGEAIPGGSVAERGASYFSIGHLSDRLLRALQVPEFHESVEALARQYFEEHPEAEDHPDPREDERRQDAPSPTTESC